jgi:uncharacterized protein YjlB
MTSGFADAVNRVEPACHPFADDGTIPNNPRLPFLVYAGALTRGGDLASSFEKVFAANLWDRSWRNGIFPFPHFHSTAHEVLGICQGEARVRFGGEQGIVITVTPGDVVVIPAGVGHQNLGASADLLVIGAYPGGQRPDLCKGDAGERPQVLDSIARVPQPQADPIRGARGPLMEHWSKGSGGA